MSPPHSSGVSPENSTVSSETIPSILSQVRQATGLDPADCYQCGKCSAGCPMASEMEIKTHEIIRLLQLDLRERLISAKSIWICLTCETCTTRCPNEFDPQPSSTLYGKSVFGNLPASSRKRSPLSIPPFSTKSAHTAVYLNSASLPPISCAAARSSPMSAPCRQCCPGGNWP